MLINNYKVKFTVKGSLKDSPRICVQSNPSTKATLESKSKWPLQRGGFYRGVLAFIEGIVFPEGGFCRGVPVYSLGYVANK